MSTRDSNISSIFPDREQHKGASMKDWKTASGITLITVSLYFWWLSDIEIASLVDPISLMVVIVPLIAATFFLTQFSNKKWSQVFWCLGLPLGLMGTTIGLIDMSRNMDPEAFIGAWPILLIITLYGALISAIGYFSISDEQGISAETRKPSALQFMWFLIPCIGILAYVGHLNSNTSFFSIPALALHCSVLGFLFLSRKTIGFTELSEASLLSAILCLVFALVLWYSKQVNATSFALSGLLYGLLLYVFSYVTSPYQNNNSRDTDIGRANWHWMEVTAFMVFMLFAPETMREAAINKQEDTNLKQQAAITEERLDALEKRVLAEKRN